MTAPGLGPVLGALHAGSGTFFGHPGAALEPVAVFDRPYSTIVRLRVVTPQRAPYYAYTKIYKVRPYLPYEIAREPAEVVVEEFAATERLHRIMAGRPGLSSPRPIASLPQHNAIVTQELEGIPLDRVLRSAHRRRRAPTLAAIATRIGTWLRAYQHAAPAGGRWCPDTNRAYLDDRLRYVVPFLGEAARFQALDLFDALAARVDATVEPLVPIHADLCPGNILVTPTGGVAVLDFATAQQGTRYHDVAHLYLHLEFVRMRRPRLAVRPVQDALIAAFDRPPAARDPLFRLMFLQHVVCHVTQLVERSGWQPQVAVRALARWRWRTCLALPALAESAPRPSFGAR
jgi:Phosphotransferase enzyme family